MASQADAFDDLAQTDDGDSDFEDAEDLTTEDEAALERIQAEMDPELIAELTEAYFDAGDDTFDGDYIDDDDDEDIEEEEDDLELIVEEEEDEGSSEEEEEEEEGLTGQAAQAENSNLLSQRAAMALLRRLQQGLFSGSDDDIMPGRRHRKRPSFVRVIQKEPIQAGVDLLNSGEFGDPLPSHKIDSSRRFPYSVRAKLLQRELLPYKRPKSFTANQFVPVSNGRLATQYQYRAYSGQFSQDGSFFYTCAQNFIVRLYDTTDPTRWTQYKLIRGNGQWTITDANLTPDNRFVAYSSITPRVYMAHTDRDNEDEQEILDFSGNGKMSYNNGIWSIRFSADGREIVAGAGDAKMYVYDVESKSVVLGVSGHTEDVNAVCFADQSSNVLFSGSDDCFIKVWDRRSMVNNKEAGVLVGHTEGVTFISSKGDGRYVISNGKDQTTKLWDIRKLISVEKWDRSEQIDYSTGFDYRHQPYPGTSQPHPDDCSVMTYTGHAILRTLIRCGFSPAATTDQQYIYSGSECGKVWIWNLDGTVARTLDLNKSGRVDVDVDTNRRRYAGFGYEDRACIRDAAWHPTLPYIVSTSWHSNMDAGSIYLHEYGESTDNDHFDDVPVLERRLKEPTQRRTAIWS